MLDKPLYDPTEQFLKSLKTVGNYARHPYGIAVIGSIGLHAVAALTLPLWSVSHDKKTETPKKQMVRVVELPPDLQNRVPAASSSPLDLSVFERNPNFNLNLQGMSRGAIATDPNGNPLNPNSTYGNYAVGMNNLPTPMAPSRGQTNFSFIPNSPPSIRSAFSGFAPPPPSLVSGLLPPPPSFSPRGNTSIFSGGNAMSNLVSPPVSSMSNGGQQQFTINPNPNSSSILQRQRQLEAEAAIALNPQTASPNDTSIRFNADLLKPSELRNQQNMAIATRPPALPSQGDRHTATISRSIAGNYPKGACSSQASGTAVYDVGVTPNGSPAQWSLAQSSGTNALDNQASQDIRNTSFDGSNSNYRVSVSYRYQPAFCAAFIPKPASAVKPVTPSASPITTPAAKPKPPVPAAEITPPAAQPPVTPKPESQQTLSVPTTAPTEASDDE